MKRSINLFTKSDAESNYAVIAQIKLPTYINIIVRYGKQLTNGDYEFYGEYEEQYRLLPMVSLWDSPLNYVPSISDYKIIKNTSNPNGGILELYFGEDVTGKTDDVSFQLLYKCRCTSDTVGFFYNIEFDYPETFGGNIRFLVNTSSNFWDSQLVVRGDLNINQSNIIAGEEAITYSSNNTIPLELKKDMIASIPIINNFTILHFNIVDSSYAFNSSIMSVVYSESEKYISYNGGFTANIVAKYDATNKLIYIQNKKNAILYIQQIGTNYPFSIDVSVDITNLPDFNKIPTYGNTQKPTYMSNIIPLRINNVLYTGIDNTPRDCYGYFYHDRIGWSFPTMQNISAEYGFMFLKYDTGKITPYFYYNNAWYDAAGLNKDLKRKGTKWERPWGSYIYVGFMYMQVDEQNGTFPIWAAAIDGDTVTWVDATGTTV